MALHYQVIPVTPFMQNASLIWCDESKKGVVVDAGGDIDKLEQAIAQHQIQIQALWLTHGHLDHVGAAKALKEKWQVPIIGPSQQDAFWLDALPQQAQMFGFPPSQVFTPDRWLTEGEILSIGQYDFAVLHCPGHTPGHVVFFNADIPLLVAGDVLFRESIGRSDFPQGNHQALIASIQDKLFTLPKTTTVITGHGPLTTIGHEKRHNPYCANSKFG